LLRRFSWPLVGRPRQLSLRSCCHQSRSHSESGLKGQNIPAQGNALGIDTKYSFSPVRASHADVSQPSVSPFQGLCENVSPNPGRCPGLICVCPLRGGR
jgi:hypothetical protein